MDATDTESFVAVRKKGTLHLVKPLKTQKDELPENCAFCGNTLHPLGITIDVSTMDVHVWCQNCAKKNSCGMITKKQFGLPSLPVVKRLVEQKTTVKCFRAASGCKHMPISLSSHHGAEEHNVVVESSEKQSMATSLEVEKAGNIPTFNRLTPEAISELMCLEARAIRRKRQKLGLNF